MAKFTKYIKGKEWTQAPKRFRTYKQAKLWVDRKKKTFRLKEDTFYYRIKGKINDFEVWYYVGKLDKHKRP